MFEIANGGTIFLDEIGDIPISLQNKLRSAIQDRKIRRVGGTKTINIDAIIISATNKKLKDEIQKGNFKDDLFYRINRNTFEIPPLRNRKEDILPLAKHFIKMSAKEFENPSLSSIDITTDGLEVMGKYDWPGNVRELENEIVRIMVVRLTNKDTSDITPYDLKKEILGSSDQTKHFKKILVGKGKRNLPEIEEVARLIDEEKLTPTEVGKIYGVRREHVSREYHKYKRLKNNHKNTS